jgi:coenzyme F420-dependent glucose-6-phosphate dehydrogenase
VAIRRGGLEIGYSLSSEERQPGDLVGLAQMAEGRGFTFALISDHYHPWTDRQGSSPFVWSVLGGIAATTKTLRVGTAVTCPIMRVHPAIVAQAAATMGCLMRGRFFLGVGSGESLNEHITGEAWPPPAIRLDMLEEAISVIRQLHAGGERSHSGRFFRVQDARIYNLPSSPVPIYVAAAGKLSAALAGRAGDGLVSTSPVAKTVQAFEAAGGSDKPRVGHLTVCWARTEEEAIATAHEFWPNAGLTGQFKNELPRVRYIEEAVEAVSLEEIGKDIVCGPDPQRHLEAIGEFARAGFDHVYVHQVGPAQEEFMRFYEREIIPQAGALAA